MTLDSIPAHSAFRTGRTGQAYNEAAFRYFLAADRWRAQRLNRLLYLVLVAVQRSPGRCAKLEDPTAASIFRALGTSVREVDFVGWFHEGLVAAAVLAQGAKGTDGGLAPLIVNRMLPELKKRLSASDSNHLRVRVIRLGARIGV